MHFSESCETTHRHGTGVLPADRHSIVSRPSRDRHLVSERFTAHRGRSRAYAMPETRSRRSRVSRETHLRHCSFADPERRRVAEKNNEIAEATTQTNER